MYCPGKDRYPPSARGTGYALYRTTNDSINTKLAEYPVEQQPGKYVDLRETCGYCTYTIETKDFGGNISQYRAVADEPMTHCIQGVATELSATDGEIEAGKEYAYRVKVAFRNGQTILSETIKIKIRK